jgi:hypothetical protein
MKTFTKILLLIFAFTSVNTHAKEAHYNTSKKVILYPKFIITYSEDFAAFKSYMNESKEEYRTRRAGELAAQSKGSARQILSFNNQTQEGSTLTASQSLSDTTTTFADPEIMQIMMQAYDKFDYNYETNKRLSRRNMSQELSGQLQSKLFTLKERNLISDDNSNLDFTYGKYSIAEMNEKIYASKNHTESRNAREISKIATHFLYGHWSYYVNEQSNTKQIKVTIFVEEIGGSIKTFEAIGSEQGEAMEKIANQVFAYLNINRNYNEPVSSFSDLNVVRPNSMDDVKTHTEAVAYCAAQGDEYRLPYSSEVIAMISQPYGPDGNIFLSGNKNYAVADLQGGGAPLKLIPAKNNNSGNSLQITTPSERISYFCISENVKQISTEKMYEQLYSAFYKLRNDYDMDITPELCSDKYDEFGIKDMKNIAIKIAKKDPTPRIKGTVKHCMITYLRGHPELFGELALISRL